MTLTIRDPAWPAAGRSLGPEFEAEVAAMAEVKDPVIRSFEPGEDWRHCYPDDLFVE